MDHVRLLLAEDEDADEARAVDERIGHRHAVGRRHLRPAVEAREAVVDAQRVGVREEARGVAIVAHPEQHEVEAVVALLAPAERLAQFVLVERVGVRLVGVDRMDLRLRNARMVDDQLCDLPVVRTLVLERHAALVDDPQMRAPPRHVAERGVDHHALVERHRRRTAREREMEVAEAAHARLRLVDDVEPDRVDRAVRVVEERHRPRKPRRRRHLVEDPVGSGLVVAHARLAEGDAHSVPERAASGLTPRSATRGRRGRAVRRRSRGPTSRPRSSRGSPRARPRSVRRGTASPRSTRPRPRRGA